MFRAAAPFMSEHIFVKYKCHSLDSFVVIDFMNFFAEGSFLPHKIYDHDHLITKVPRPYAVSFLKTKRVYETIFKSWVSHDVSNNTIILDSTF